MPSYKISKDLERIELHLNKAEYASECEKVKKYGFKWDRKEKFWYAEKTEERLSFVRKLCRVKTKSDFLKAVQDPKEFIASLEEFVRSADRGEKTARQNSLCEAIKEVVNDDRIKDNVGFVAEYQIPRCSEHIDVMLSGKRGKNTVILIIELKQWSKSKIKFSKEENKFIIGEKGGQTYKQSHPAQQLQNYKKLIELGTPEEYRKNLEIHCIGYLHNYQKPKNENDPIKKGQGDHVEMFFSGEKEKDRLIEHIKALLPEGDNGEGVDYIDKHCTGRSYAATEFIKLGLDTLETKTTNGITANQLSVFETIKKTVQDAIDKKEEKSKKKVLIVKGGAETGKSVTAMYTAATLHIDPNLQNEKIVFLSKTASPQEAFGDILGDARAFLCKSTDEFIRKKESFLLTLVDESHRLTRETLKGDYKNRLGDDKFISKNHQIHDIIEYSEVSVFFIDEQQVVSLKDAGTIDEITNYCKEKDYVVEIKELTDQLGYEGTYEYTKWVDSLLDGEANKLQNQPDYDIAVMDSFDEFYEEMQRLEKDAKKLNKTDGGKHRARMAAGFCWRWESHNNFNEKRDFPKKMRQLRWNKKMKDYVWATAEDSFDQVGCIHTCRGVKFDYIGVIIGPDMVLKDGQIETDYTQRARDKIIYEYGRKKGDGKGDSTLNKDIVDKKRKSIKNIDRKADEIIRNTYRVLLTHGLKGCRIYCAKKDGSLNRELSDYIKNLLNQ